MQYDHSQWIFTASDLSGFSSCRHKSFLAYHAALHQIEPAADNTLQRVALHAVQKLHTTFRLLLSERYGPVLTLPDPSEYAHRSDAVKQTLDAVQSGSAVIENAVLMDVPWFTSVDFLIRLPASPTDPIRYGAAQITPGYHISHSVQWRFLLSAWLLGRATHSLPADGFILLGNQE
ncbi:MAG: hypothetical protein OWS74_06920, partial [Firmicutes bacterium]|nr:hypothetical protein [Bacillota bacterium]